MDDFSTSMFIAASGMHAQGIRLKVISENIANANSTADKPGGDPYRRKVATFRNVLDRELGADTVRVKSVVEDNSQFSLRYDPANPAANADGYVKLPNVNTLIEMTDMREAQRSYEANLNVIEASKNMVNKTLDMLR